MPDPKSRWEIADVLDRTDLSVLLDELAQPAGRLGPGRRWHCPMPDHDDHRASVSMFRDRHGHERWRCWSGDHRGDAVDLVCVVTGRARSDAVDWLAGRAGMTPDRPLPPIPAKRPPAAAAATTVSPLVERYVRLCERVLGGPQGATVRDWLHARGLSDNAIVANRVGADIGRRFMRRSRGLPYGAGPAAVFPAFDPAGHVTYVQARYLEPDVAGRKYDNPATALAPHPRLAFPAATGEDRGGVLVVCEGIPDALVAAQAGYRAVGLLGAHTPDEFVAARLANHADHHHLRVAIVCDPDPAGRHATGTLAGLLDDLGIDALTLSPPDGYDLNAWAMADPHWTERLDEHLGRDTATVEVDQ